jgi:VanZ family protein
MLLSLIRVAAWLAVVAIVVLSVVPGQVRPDVLGEKHIEHLVAYFGTAMLLAAGYSRRYQLVLICVVLSACSGLLEVVQLWIPGRSSSVIDFAVSSLGAWTGVAMIALFGAALMGPYLERSP